MKRHDRVPPMRGGEDELDLHVEMAGLSEEQLGALLVVCAMQVAIRQNRTPRAILSDVISATPDADEWPAIEAKLRRDLGDAIAGRVGGNGDA